MKNKIEGQTTQSIKITGPFGIGKSYAILKSILKLKKKKNFVVIHIVLSETYLNNFAKHFLKDLIFGLAIFNDDIEFPNAPKKPKNSHNKILDWAVYMKTQLDSKNKNMSIFSEFYERVLPFLKKKNIFLVNAIDQQNTYFANISSLTIPEVEFIKALMSNGFSDFLMISASNTNEGFENFSQSKTDVLKNVLILNHNFSKNETIILLKELNNNYLSEGDVEDIFNLTENNPLEVYLFSCIIAENYEDKKKTMLI